MAFLDPIREEGISPTFAWGWSHPCKRLNGSKSRKIFDVPLQFSVVPLQVRGHDK